MLVLLGEQLIRDSGLAVFELVKNAYDADASVCRVTVETPFMTQAGRIVVEDDGSGMTFELLRDVYLVIGTDFRAKQKAVQQSTPIHGRLPLGEKGVGRLAVHKLGHKISLVTRAAGRPEVVMNLDWDAFDTASELDDVKVAIKSREPEVFTGSKHGTRIEVTKLREDWTRAKVRALHRAVVSLCSPFDTPSDFKVTFSISPQDDWLEGLLNVSNVLEDALYRASGWIEGSQVVYDYRFVPFEAMRNVLEGRTEQGLSHRLVKKVGRHPEPLDLSPYKIGRVGFQFHIFDREPRILDLATSDKKGLKEYLDQNGGVRIYRDGIRVFDFGEPGNDWLNLGGRRVNKPTVRVSNNQIIGALMLKGAQSGDLIEKTNREGFIENSAYEALRDAVTFALAQIEAERQKDQKLVRLHYSRQGPNRPVLDEITDLREALDRRGLLPEFADHLARIEKQYSEVQETMLAAAAPGLTFAAVIHQAEKVIKELVQAVETDADRRRIRNLVNQIAQMMDGLTFLVRKSGMSRERASVLIQQACFNNELRFRAHRVVLVNGLEHGDRDFIVKCVRRLIVATLMNFLDNSIYWLDSTGQSDKRIYVGTSFELDDRPSLVVADNGPGFRDDVDAVTQPFFSRKPEGMGLGLYIANEVAKQHQGARLVFPSRGDVRLPREFTGAIVALQFPAAV